LNKEDPDEKYFIIYDVMRGDYVKKIAKKSMEDEAYCVDHSGSLLIHAEGDYLHFALIRIPNSASLNQMLKPRY
jgi:hypothetical protein